MGVQVRWARIGLGIALMLIGLGWGYLDARLGIGTTGAPHSTAQPRYAHSGVQRLGGVLVALSWLETGTAHLRLLMSVHNNGHAALDVRTGMLTLVLANGQRVSAQVPQREGLPQRSLRAGGQTEGVVVFSLAARQHLAGGVLEVTLPGGVLRWSGG